MTCQSTCKLSRLLELAIMLQLRIAVVGTTLAVGAWGAYTYQDRQKLPVEKKRHFTPGSAGETIKRLDTAQLQEH